MEECKHDEYCPLYLSYLGENIDDLKYCRNSNNQYCTKYRLLNAVLEGVTENVNIPDFILSI